MLIVNASPTFTNQVVAAIAHNLINWISIGHPYTAQTLSNLFLQRGCGETQELQEILWRLKNLGPLVDGLVIDLLSLIWSLFYYNKDASAIKSDTIIYFEGIYLYLWAG